MENEKILVKCLLKNTEIINVELKLYEEAPENQDMVRIDLALGDNEISCTGENFFNTLLEIRKELEKMNILIVCNGAAENVYPSPMQLSMGTGRTAYRQCLHQQARMTDVVDIFEYDENLKIVDVETQLKYHNEWLKSIMGR